MIKVLKEGSGGWLAPLGERKRPNPAGSEAGLDMASQSWWSPKWVLQKSQKGAKCWWRSEPGAVWAWAQRCAWEGGLPLESWEGRQSSSARVLFVILRKLDLILKAMENPLKTLVNGGGGVQCILEKAASSPFPSPCCPLLAHPFVEFHSSPSSLGSSTSITFIQQGIFTELPCRRGPDDATRAAATTQVTLFLAPWAHCECPHLLLLLLLEKALLLSLFFFFF